MKDPLCDQTIFQTSLLPFLQQTFRSQFNHIAGNLAGVCSRWHRSKLLGSHTLQFCLLGHMRCITCTMWWNSGAHRSTISIPAVCHVTCKTLWLAQVRRCHLTMFIWSCLCLQMEVQAPPGTTVGYIKQDWHPCLPRFSIQGANKETVMKLEGPCFACNCCGDVNFEVRYQC